MKIEKTIKDHFLTNENFTLVKHDKGVLRTMPDLSDIALSKYYESEKYASHNRVRGFLGSLYVLFSRMMLKFKFGTIKRHLEKEGLVVDFGCGNGDFLSYVSAQNKKVIGIENNKRAVEVCEKKQIKVLSSVSSVQSKINAITFWHSFEHLSNPEKVIKAVKKHTDNDSVIVVALPNYKSFDARYYDRFWAAYDVPRHRFHYSKTGIKQTMKKFGFQCVKTKPMFLDAFYISMISEKYKNNKLFFVKGFVVGMISNLFAIFNSNYSSSLFVFKKSI